MNDRITKICGMLAATVFSFALALSARSADVDRNTLIAHRGESVDAPENTMPAFRMAVERGFGFECDIYLSKDGRVFTFHDRDLKRTTGGANCKKCAEAGWDEISRLDVGNWGKWKNSRFAGTRPALLEEVLELARDGRYIYVEIKPGPEIVPYVKRIFEKQKKATPANTLFISFNADSCKALKEQMPEYKVYWLTGMYGIKKSGKPPAEYMLSLLGQTGADGVDCQFNPEVITAEVIAAVRNAGYEFHVWTIDNLALTREAFRRGAMTVTTNRAQLQYRQFLAEKSGDKSVAR